MARNRLHTIKFGFALPMIFIFILMITINLLIDGMRDGFIIDTVGMTFLTEAKAGVYILGFFVFLILISIAKRVALHKIILTVFLGFPLLIGFFGLVLVPLIPDNEQTSLLLRYWPIAGYYILTSFWMAGSFFFFWAFGNNHFSFRQAGYYYPILLMLSLFMSLFVKNYFDSILVQYTNLPMKFAVVNALVFVIGLVIFVVYFLMSRNLPNIQHELDSRSDEIDKLFGVRYLITIGMIAFAISYLAVYSSEAFGKIAPLDQLTSTIQTWQLVTIYLLAPLAFVLYILRGKGWRYTAYSVAFFVIISFFASWVTVQYSNGFSLLGAGIYNVLMSGLLAPFILILKEMSFIAVPKETRFFTKTWVDIFFMGAGMAVANLFFAPLTVLILIVYVVAIHMTGLRIEKFAPYKKFKPR
ncbi:MAG: hypothetical protein K940chlam3_00526 [Chlamydiae bacterium]|nr:hypothetical protein [Chlamydiota bacterium]